MKITSHLIAISLIIPTLMIATLISGGGHGWITGMYGCFLLCPLIYISATNALQIQSYKLAIKPITIGLVICAIAVVMTYISNSEKMIFLENFVEDDHAWRVVFYTVPFIFS